MALPVSQSFNCHIEIFVFFSELLSGMALGWNHFKAMFIKRFLNSKREKKAVVTQLILPAVVTLLGLALAQTLPTQKADPSRVLSVGNYLESGKTGVAYFADYRNSPDPNLLKVCEMLLCETFQSLMLFIDLPRILTFHFSPSSSD